MFSGRVGVICLLAVSSSLPALSYGQNSKKSAAPTDGTAKASTLEAVTVSASSQSAPSEKTKSYTVEESRTATRLPLTLRETPQSVTVITRQRMEDQQLNSAQDVLENVTGISSYTNDTSRTSYYSRGFQIDSFQYDGIPTTFVNGASYLDMAFYDRLEVVRGATGLVTGSGSPSASVNLVRKRPKRVFDASVSASAGSYDSYRGVADISTPINKDGTVRARIVGVYQRNGSFMDRLKEEKKSFYGIVEADLTRDTTLSLGYDYQRITPKGTLWNGLPWFYSDGTRTQYRRSKSPSVDWAHWDNTLSNTFLRLEHQFENDWSLHANFNHGEERVDSELFTPSVGGYPSRGAGFAADDYPYILASHSKSQSNSLDFNASGPFSLLGRRHEAVIGAMYSRRRESGNSTGKVDGSTVISDFDGFNGNYPRPDFDAIGYNSHSGAEYTQSGIYAALRFSLTDSLNLIAGGRFNNYESDSLSRGQWTSYKKTGKFTPYTGLIYTINDVYSAYVSHTQIFKPQSYHDKNGNPLSPTVGKTTEAGIKAGYLNGRLNVAVSVFDNRLDNVAQVDGDNLTPTGGTAYRGANGTKSQGYDVDVQGEITPNWKVYAGISHFTASSQDGSRLQPTIPRSTVRLFTSYRLPGDWQALTVGGGVNWQSRMINTITSPTDGKVQIEQSPYALVSLMARYEVTPKSDVTLNVNNLFDKGYYKMFGFYNRYIYGTPRMVSLTYKHRF